MAAAETKLSKNWADRSMMIMIAGSALITVALIVVPLISGISLSFFKISSYNVAATPEFVGLKNIVKSLKSDAFWNAFGNGVTFTALSVFVQLFLALLIALVLNGKVPLRGAIRTAIIIPMLVPTVVVTTLDRYITNETFGIISLTMQKLGFEPIAWGTPEMAMIHVVMLGAWLWMPFMVLSVLAELQSVPGVLYEAARVDGANRFQQFMHITLPHLASVLGVIILLRSIWCFNNFELIFLSTGGGPLGMTETLPILAYRQSFTLFDVGMGAATSTLSFVFLLVVVVIASRFLKLGRV